MILNDKQITDLAHKGMITPFFKERLQPFGYDITLSTKFKIFRGRQHFVKEPDKLIYTIEWMKKNDYILDPFNARESDFEEFEGDICVVPPLSFVLGMSLERFKMPNNVMGICLGRSSYSRMGIVPNITPLESGWEGFITIEIFNGANMPNMAYANKGISQVRFDKGQMPLRNYVQKGGRYQNQEGITLTKGV